MTNSRQNYTGTDYNATAALLVFAFVFSPAMLMLSRPIDFVTVAVASSVSALCVAVAWISWSRFSMLTIASVVR